MGTRIERLHDRQPLRGRHPRRSSVFAPIRVGVFSSGDELVDPGTPPEALRDGQIYDSNRATVKALLARATLRGRRPAPAARCGRRGQTVREAAGRRVPRVAIVLGHERRRCASAMPTSSRPRSQELGELDFWKLNLKPGKPLAFGRIGRLPPVRFARQSRIDHRDPAPARHPGYRVSLAGTTPTPALRMPARLTNAISHSPGRTEFQRGVRSERDAQGLSVRAHRATRAPTACARFAVANCLIEVPAPDAADLARWAAPSPRYRC